MASPDSSTNSGSSSEEEVLEQPDDDIFYKDTESYRCLTQILISRSSLLRHPLYNFPALQDPGLTQAFNREVPETKIDKIGCEYYLKLCKDMKIAPYKRVLKSLPTEILDLQYYGLPPKQIQAILATLHHNSCVRQLIFEENQVSPREAECMSDMLLANNHLVYLNLSRCNIGTEEINNLAEGIEGSLTVTRLDLSYNNLGDKGIELLEDALSHNMYIKKLNLSHNNLGETAAQLLGSIFSYNNTIKDVDLSWNNFSTAAGNKPLFEALINSEVVKVLNLSWDNLKTEDAVKPLAKYLKNTPILEEIDLSCNRFEKACVKLIRNGIKQCKTLRRINLRNNVITPDEAMDILDILVFDPKRPLNYLNMDTTFVLKNFVPKCIRLEKQGKVILIGGVNSNYTIKGPDTLKILFARANFLAMKKNKNFGHFILQLPKETTKKQFQALLKKAKIKLDKELADEIIKRFSVKKDNIDVVAMKDSYMGYYPDTVLPKVERKKGKKKGTKGKKKAREELAAEGQPPGEELPPIGKEEQTEDAVPLATEQQITEPPAVADEQPPTVADEQPPAVADEQPPTVTDKQPPAVADEQPPTVTDEQPPAVADKQPPAVADEQPPAVADEQPPTETISEAQLN